MDLYAYVCIHLSPFLNQYEYTHIPMHTHIHILYPYLSVYLPIPTYIERKGTYCLLCCITRYLKCYLGVKRQLMFHTSHFIYHGLFVLVFIRTLYLSSLYCQSSSGEAELLLQPLVLPW